MRRPRLLSCAVMVALVMLSAFIVLARRAGTQEKPLQDRVANLEMQVSDLQARIMRLEKQSSQLAPTLPAPSQNIAPSKVAWRSLQKGMNKSQVRRILGEPKNISMFSTFEAWDFTGGGSVKFDDSGTVDGWSEPLN